VTTRRHRARKGQGSVYQRADGYWIASQQVDGVRYTASASTSADAQRKLKGKLSPKIAAPDSLSLEAFLLDWLASSVAYRVGPTTRARYTGLTRTHLIPGLGHIAVGELRPIHVETLLNQALDTGLAPRTVFHIRAVLLTALNYAVKSELATMNAAALADPPKLNDPEIFPLDQVQARQLIEAAKGDRLEAVYLMALYLGMREGELLGLRWTDLDFARNRLTIRRGLGPVDGKVQEISTKTKKSRRVIPLVGPIAGALQRHHQRQESIDVRLAGQRWQHAGHIFTTTIGTPIDATNFGNRTWPAMRTKAALPSTVKFHHLRHTTATLLLEAEVPMEVVRDILGHSSIVLTVNTYGHVSEKASRTGLQKLVDVLEAHTANNASN
jgi:integrase